MRKSLNKIKEAILPLRQVASVCLGRVSPHAKKRRERQKAFYGQFIRSGDLVFDLGAHIGNKTDIFLNLGARVVSVEPQKRCMRIIKSRFGRNKNVVLVNKGAAEKEGTAQISICDRANMISTFSDKWKKGRFKAYAWNRTEKICVTTLDSLIGQFGLPRFCKIDIEGYELNALKGLTRALPYMSFEYTKEFLDDAAACIDYIESLGPVQFNCSTERLKLFFKEWKSGKEVLETLRGIDDNMLHGEIFAASKEKE